MTFAEIKQIMIAEHVRIEKTKLKEEMDYNRSIGARRDKGLRAKPMMGSKGRNGR